MYECVVVFVMPLTVSGAGGGGGGRQQASARTFRGAGGWHLRLVAHACRCACCRCLCVGCGLGWAGRPTLLRLLAVVRHQTAGWVRRSQGPSMVLWLWLADPNFTNGLLGRDYSMTIQACRNSGDGAGLLVVCTLNCCARAGQPVVCLAGVLHACEAERWATCIRMQGKSNPIIKPSGPT